MNRHIFFPRLWLLLFLSLSLIALSACARPPVKEMAGAGVALSAARDAGAVTHAPDNYSRAKNLFDQSVRDVDASDYGSARRHAIEARKVALEAEEVSRLAGQLNRRKIQGEGVEKDQPKTLPSVLASVKPPAQTDGVEQKEVPDATVRAANQYRVIKGESLWKISGYPQVYNDPFQWPLLYRANRQGISDPDLIYPGQELDIPRDHSPKDAADAIRVAKNRGAWSLRDGK
ncbi:MAG: LysM peptidoglycan-binding domain-containing protein [Nitrospinota bacterium]